MLSSYHACAICVYLFTIKCIASQLSFLFFVVRAQYHFIVDSSCFNCAAADALWLFCVPHDVCVCCTVDGKLYK